MDDLLLLILCSPSGAGKSTLTRFLLAELTDLTFSVSHTTRKPRANEVDGKHYHFTDKAEFQAMVQAGMFAEWAHVHDNMYGTSLAEIEPVPPLWISEPRTAAANKAWKHPDRDGTAAAKKAVITRRANAIASGTNPGAHG